MKGSEGGREKGRQVGRHEREREGGRGKEKSRNSRMVREGNAKHGTIKKRKIGENT